MFCGSCGQEVTNQDKFCGSCGAAVPQDILEGGILEGQNTPGKREFIPESVTQVIETVNQISETAQVPIQREVTVKTSMSKKSKVVIGVVVVIALMLYGGYQFARSKFIIVSPFLLQQKFTMAIKSRDMTTLSSLLDSESSDLKNSNSLAAFKTSLTDDVMASYLQKLQQEVDQVQSRNAYASTSDHGWLTIKQKSTWLGKSWVLHIASVGVKAKPIAQDTVAFSIGNLKSADGEIAHLWPSSYAFKGTVSNDYAKQDVSGNVSFLDQLGNIQAYGAYDDSLDMSGYITSNLTLNVPDSISNPQVLINSKAISIPNNGINISPAPSTGTLELKGTVLGVSIDEKEPFDTPNIDLSNLMNKGIAKHALAVIYNAQSSEYKAYNDGNASELTNADPNGSYYTQNASYINGFTAPPSKQVLQKVIVDPQSVQISNNTISIQDSEYSNNSSDAVNMTYSLQQGPSKKEWWVTQAFSSYQTVNDPTGNFTKSS
ncbi:hypothetical protein DEAC_c39860 [Desulfosporosinus acididurans]|uniref:Zinc-ribbon domain-containing protein n=1 Tax=Desulfosporosinus acididurans TaxID=476652 RepID=A0A0J1IHL3_9FIRM|nr:zinc ribbon domain-containing protein [Desulfosporosinus acididurans]KLU64171.1 hypothetical protein DEAC_c39860 [Desulfosporosinus acididurans]